MSRKWSGLLTVAAIAALVVLSAFPVAAAGAPGTGPDSALALPSDWTQLAVGQRVWYAFQYAGDGSQVDVRVSVSPDSSAAQFAVWTPADLRSWQAGNGENPVGRGSANPDMNNDLFWSGHFYAPGTYYVVIDQTGPVPAYYMLTVTGSGVSLRMMCSM